MVLSVVVDGIFHAIRHNARCLLFPSCFYGGVLQRKIKFELSGIFCNVELGVFRRMYKLLFLENTFRDSGVLKMLTSGTNYISYLVKRKLKNNQEILFSNIL